MFFYLRDPKILFSFQIVRLIDADDEKFHSVIGNAGLNKLQKSEVRYLREFVYVMEPVATALDILQRDNDMYIGYLNPVVLRMEANLKARRLKDGKALVYCEALLNTLIKAIRTERRFLPFLENEELKLASCLIPMFKMDWVADPMEKTSLRANLVGLMKQVDLTWDSKGII